MRVIARFPAFALRDQLLGSLPEACILEIQARSKLDLAVVKVVIGEPARIKVEIGRTRQPPRVLPLSKFAAGRHKCQPVTAIMSGRGRQAFDDGFAVTTLCLLVGYQQVPG